MSKMKEMAGLIEGLETCVNWSDNIIKAYGHVVENFVIEQGCTEEEIEYIDSQIEVVITLKHKPEPDADLATRYQALCIAWGHELSWTPEECNEYDSWDELRTDAIHQWADEIEEQEDVTVMGAGGAKFTQEEAEQDDYDKIADADPRNWADD